MNYETQNYTHQDWPAWRYDPKSDDAGIFNSEDEVPAGWVDWHGKFEPKEEAVEEPSVDKPRRGRPPKADDQLDKQLEG